MQFLRLRGRKICDRVIRLGYVWKGKTMIIRWLPGVPPREPRDSSTLYLGTLASTHLHKSAVKRNRMRRRCKEAFRLILKAHTQGTAGISAPLSGTFQLLVSPRSSSLSLPFDDIQQDVSRFLSSLR